MRLSSLQKSIMVQAYDQKGRLRKKGIEQWYAHVGHQREMSYRDAQHTVTISVERLIDKGLMVGYGVRTPQKWFIHEVKLTPEGKRVGKKLRGVQQELPMSSGSKEQGTGSGNNS